MDNKSKIIMNCDENDKIEINTPMGSSVKTKADEITMRGAIKQNSFGGKILHKANNQLNQFGNKMTAKDNGEIINQSDGELNQIGNEMTAENKGKIHNLVKKNLKG